MHKIKEMLMKELKAYEDTQRLNVGDLDLIWKLTDTIKNIDKIEMLDEGYSEQMSYDDGNSYARGRGRYAKRDSMGRYSSDYDYSENYSRNGAKDHLMNKLGEMMEGATPTERNTLKEVMRKLDEVN